MTFTVFTDMGSCSLKLCLSKSQTLIVDLWLPVAANHFQCEYPISEGADGLWPSIDSNYSPFTWVHEQSNLSPRWFWWNGLIRAECLMPGVSNLAPRGPLSCSTYFSSNTNYTHLNQLIKVFRLTRNIHASVLRQVGDQLCRTLALQEQEWTPLPYADYLMLYLSTTS